MIPEINVNNIRIFIQRIKLAIFTLFKWVAVAILTGTTVGLVGALFSKGLVYVTQLRTESPYLLFFLPLSGLLIVLLYKVTGQAKNTGTNLVITAIQSNDDVPSQVAPLIIISTLITHLFGGSAGREGAALQVGGCIGNFFGKLFHFDDKDTRILIMCGMSACFSALFGTPIAAAIFSMEVISVGVMYYAALVPCVLSALIAERISRLMGIAGTHFDIGDIVTLDVSNGFRFIIIAIFFAFASVIFCIVLHNATTLYNKFLKNAYIRIIIAGLLIIAMRYIFQTTDYLGAGTDVIASSFVTSAAWYVCLLKLIFTAVTLGGGFKGGEIVPALFVGATLGSFLAPIFGLPIGLCAACGMVSVFCGVTNCPLTSFIISIEMFGAESMKFCMLCIAFSYLLSGYYSLYKKQKIMYSKYRTEFLGRNTH